MLKKVLKACLGLAIIAYLLYTFDVNAIISTILIANPFLLILSLLVYASTFLILTIRWRYILSSMGLNIPILPAYLSFVGGVLLSDMTPSRIGDFLRPYVARRYINTTGGFASVVIDKYMDLLTILLLSCIGFLLLYIYKTIYNSKVIYYMLLSFAILIFVFVIVSLVLWFQRTKIINFIKNKPQILIKIDESISKIKHPVQVLVHCILLTLFAWITHTLRVSLIAQSVGYSIPFLFIFFLIPLIYALSMIPISISGLGLVEGGITALLLIFGIPPHIGISIALLDRGLTVFFHLLVGSRYLMKSL